MSEFQFVAFRAVDAPVSKENLQYMRKQSTRAHITAWEFENEYHFGDFRGNYKEMLLRGYDVHLHYANFGIRLIALRLPYGLPNPKLVKPYLGKHELEWLPDKTGSGGTLVIAPYHDEAYDYDDEPGDFDAVMQAIVEFRGEIMTGDLRPWYLAHLALANDHEHDPEETSEGPIPAGLDQLTSAQKRLAKFWLLDKALLTAAARLTPPLSQSRSEELSVIDWLRTQSTDMKNTWLAELIEGSGKALQAKVRAAYKAAKPDIVWPTAPASRTMAQLRELADEEAKQAKQRADAKAERLRMAHLAELAKSPAKACAQAEKLAQSGGVAAYIQAATLLKDLYDALSAQGKSHIPQQFAQRLREQYHTKRHLIKALREQGLLKK